MFIVLSVIANNRNLVCPLYLCAWLSGPAKYSHESEKLNVITTGNILETASDILI
jgi:hypothetical protein